MASELLAMHRAFVAGVAERRQQREQEFKKELDQLQAVEDYHQKIIAELSGAPQNGAATPAVKVGEISDMRLLTAKRHEACLIALEALGGKAKTKEIAEWLRSRGYGAQFSERVFHNTCYTAMNRRREFTLVGKGVWERVKFDQVSS